MGEQGSLPSAAVCVWGGGLERAESELREVSFTRESWQRLLERFR